MCRREHNNYIIMNFKFYFEEDAPMPVAYLALGMLLQAIFSPVQVIFHGW